MRNVYAVFGCLILIVSGQILAQEPFKGQVKKPDVPFIQEKKIPPTNIIKTWVGPPPRITSIAPLDPDRATPVAVVGETTLEISGENFTSTSNVHVTPLSEIGSENGPSTNSEIISWEQPAVSPDKVNVFIGNDFPWEAGNYLVWVQADGWSNPVVVYFERRYAGELQAAVKSLTRQEVSLGSAATGDQAGPNLIHYQRDNSFNSIEMHSDGTIYVAYTPPTSPLWYETYDANEATSHKKDLIRAGDKGTREFYELKSLNTDEWSWAPWLNAFPSGRGPAPRWVQISSNVDLPGAAPIVMPDPGAYCFHDVVTCGFGERCNTPWTGGPPEWNTVLPIDSNGKNGQKTYNPLQRLNASGNHYVSWAELKAMVHTDPSRAQQILQYRGHPNEDDTMDRRIPWMSSTLEGTVTNSFLSGDDYSGTHRAPARNYWLGSPPPRFNHRDNWFPDDASDTPEHIWNDLSDDWIVFVKPDPEYRFLLVGDPQSSTKNSGNFNAELRANVENEIEQWLVPVGYRPEPGDRIFMSGRWIIDCGHDDWHAELHPFESYVSSHRESRDEALGLTEVVSSVVVTGAWPGGVLEFDLWPPARPSPTAVLKWNQELAIASELALEEEPLPRDNPNHLHIRVSSTTPWAPLLTKDYNDVYYNVTRRLVSKYRLWWMAG